MKTIQYLQLIDDLEFLYYVVLIDFLRIAWVYVIICLLAELFL